MRKADKVSVLIAYRIAFALEYALHQMGIDDSLRRRIEENVRQKPVVLFMKGNRRMPQCGFSATVVDILSSYVSEFHTVDVLQDGEIREGIKAYSEWPTLPQLYVDGEFLGGCDIISELDQSGELSKALGSNADRPEQPILRVTNLAAEKVKEALAEAEPGEKLRLSIEMGGASQLSIGDAEPGDTEIDVNGLEIRLCPASVRRAHGVTLDYVESEQGTGFRVDHPNAPPTVRQLSVQELKARMDRGEVPYLIDVRTIVERNQATIEGSRLFDDKLTAELDGLDRNTPLYVHCHHGGRSQRAAQQFISMGFCEVYNVAGGIDAWSTQVDSQVPRY